MNHRGDLNIHKKNQTTILKIFSKKVRRRDDTQLARTPNNIRNIREPKACLDFQAPHVVLVGGIEYTLQVVRHTRLWGARGIKGHSRNGESVHRYLRRSKIGGDTN